MIIAVLLFTSMRISLLPCLSALRFSVLVQQKLKRFTFLGIYNEVYYIRPLLKCLQSMDVSFSYSIRGFHKREWLL